MNQRWERVSASPRRCHRRTRRPSWTPCVPVSRLRVVRGLPRAQNRPATTSPVRPSAPNEGTTEIRSTVVAFGTALGVGFEESSQPSTAPASISGGPTHISLLVLPWPMANAVPAPSASPNQLTHGEPPASKYLPVSGTIIATPRPKPERSPAATVPSEQLFWADSEPMHPR